MRNLFKSIYTWFINPDESQLDISNIQKLILTGKILLLELLMAIPFVGIIYLIHHYIVRLEQPLMDLSPVLLIALVVIIVPAIEELIFRLPLRFNRNYLARFINWISRGRLFNNWNSIYKYFLYVMIVAFGLMHLTNYTNREPIFFLLAPIIVGSQIMTGIGLSYCRVKLGLGWSILQHGLFNFTLILLGLVFYHNSTIINQTVDSTNLNITGLMYIDKHDLHYSTKKVDDLILSIEARNISLFQLVDSLQIDGPKPYENSWINVDITSEEGITKAELLNILKNEIKFME